MACLIVQNIFAGKYNKFDIIPLIKEKFKSIYDKIDILNTKEDRTETIFDIRNVFDSYERIIVLGGDGTLNTVAEAVSGLDNRPAIGYVPLGTVNDFAHINGIPNDIHAAVDNIANGYVASRPIMKVNNRMCTYVCAAGMFTSSSYTTKQDHKQRFGRMAYVFNAVFLDKNRKGVTLTFETADGYKETTKVALIGAIYGNRVGGLRTRKEVVFDDKLDLICIKRNGRFFPLITSLITIIKAIAKGSENLKQTKNFSMIRTNKVAFTNCKDVLWNFDGEEGYQGDITVEVLPNQYEIIVPKH